MKKNDYDKLKIFQLNKPPTYDIYSNVTEIFSETEFKIDYKKYANINYNEDTCDVSVMISPNNPTGEIINKRTGMFQIIDAVYDIPPFTNTFTPLNTKYSDNEIYIESFSKLGVPSYRLGWAVMNNSMLASKAWEYNKLHNLGMITPSFYASKNIVNIFNQHENSFDIFSKISSNILKQRRKELTSLLSSYNLYNRNLTKTIYSPYIMVPLKREEFISMGIDTRDGEDFFYPDYSRINLMMDTEDYKKMIKVLKTNLKNI
jgi:aspartate/methionine/tyrosine aminotransferase